MQLMTQLINKANYCEQRTRKDGIKPKERSEKYKIRAFVKSVICKKAAFGNKIWLFPPPHSTNAQTHKMYTTPSCC
jgi:hypothetical protein